MRELVLSLFPGIDLLGRGFEAEGFCVVRGPDLLWDQKIEEFTARGLVGHFHGIIAGPPCQQYSTVNRRRRPAEGDRLLRECLRVIDEARPEWFLIENVPAVPDVAVWPYHVQRLDLTDDECGGRQRRLRHVQFGSRWGDLIRPARTNGRRSVTARAVLCAAASNNERHSRRAAAQGVPGLRLRSLCKTARYRALGNAVPLPVARTLAAAVTRRGPGTDADCVCGCGRPVNGSQLGHVHATASCRKRMERRRRTPRRIVSLTAAASH